MKKKFMAILLAVAMLLSFSVSAIAAELAEVTGAYSEGNVTVTGSLPEGTYSMIRIVDTQENNKIKGAATSTSVGSDGKLNVTINTGALEKVEERYAIWVNETSQAVAEGYVVFGALSKPLEDVTFSDLSLSVGNRGKATVTLTPPDAEGNYTTTGWRSDNESVATVAEDGTVTAVAAGTATISVDVSINDGEAVVKTFKVTVSSGNRRPSSGGGGGASASTSTVTITSDDNSVKADVKISGSTATIGKVDKLDKVIGDGVVNIDLSNEKKDISTVKVDSSIVNAIANDENSEGLVIKLADGTVILDADAVVAVKGGDLTIKLDKTNGLNSKQKDAVKDMDVHAYYELTVNGTKALKGGNVDVRIPFAIPSDKDADGFGLYFVAEDGTLEAVSARFSGGEVRFTASAFGDYVIAYKAAEPGTPSEEQPVTADCDGGSNCPAHKFTDVNTSLWYHKAVDYAITNGLMSGVGDSTFSPNANLSRAMLAQILYNLAGKPAVTGTSAFNDVAAGQWYANAVAWATANGVVSGYGNGKFGPNDNITREQLAVMLYRYAGSPDANGSLDGFADAGKVSGYAQNALVWATANGVMSGKGGGMLDPQGMATRAEVAQMLYNYLNR